MTSLKTNGVTTPNANAQWAIVNLRLKQYQSLALQTVPVGDSEPGLAQVILFALRFFGRRPWAMGDTAPKGCIRGRGATHEGSREFKRIQSVPFNHRWQSERRLGNEARIVRDPTRF